MSAQTQTPDPEVQDEFGSLSELEKLIEDADEDTESDNWEEEIAYL